MKGIRLQILPEKRLHGIEGNDVRPVVQVRMAGAGNDHELLVLSPELFEGVFAEVAGMRLFPMDEQHRAADFSRVAQQGHIHEGKR